MLKQRLITAAILVPIVLLGIFYLPLVWFGWISAAVFLCAGWEWAKLAGIKQTKLRLLFLFIALMIFWIIGGLPEVIPLVLGVLTWVVLPLFLGKREVFGRYWEAHAWFRLSLGIWLLGLAWYSVNFVLWQGYGSLLLLTLFIWVWGADVGAFFAGRAYGKRKLAVNISPGKSWEGVLGGAIVTFMMAVLMGFLFPFGIVFYFGFLLLSIIIAAVSVVGDLVESMIKRQCDVKDSGQLLPGHGGLLDRLDSLLSAAPIFAAGIVLLEFLK